MLTFKVASFDIGYNCILGRPFLLKFKAVIHTTYATMKMSGLKGVITIKTDQWDALACENTSLSHAGRFGDKATQNQEAKTKGGSASCKTSAPKPPTSGTPWAPIAQKGTNVASTYTWLSIDQKADNKQKGTAAEEDKNILVDPNNLEKKLQVSSNLDSK
jgi:hypothetical protein